MYARFLGLKLQFKNISRHYLETICFKFSFLVIKHSYHRTEKKKTVLKVVTCEFLNVLTYKKIPYKHILDILYVSSRMLLLVYLCFKPKIPKQTDLTLTFCIPINAIFS